MVHTFVSRNREVGVTAGVVNLFDRGPPIRQSASLNVYDASIYDIPAGRFVYLKVTLKLGS